jgi:hypothetical protein
MVICRESNGLPLKRITTMARSIMV